MCLSAKREKKYHMSSDEFGIETIKIVSALDKKGVKKITVLMRHSAKQVDESNPGIEAFMGLTSEGSGTCAELVVLRDHCRSR